VRNPRKAPTAYLFRGMSLDYGSMIPRFSPIVTAWVRSLAPSLERMFLMWLFTLSSVIDSRAAISLFGYLRGDLR
jgi:hypothetical protein